MATNEPVKIVEFGTVIVSDRSNNPLTVLSQGEPFRVIIGYLNNNNSYAIINAKYYLMSGNTFCASGPVENKSRIEAGWGLTSVGGDGSTVRSGASVNTGTNLFTYMNATNTKTRNMPINYIRAVITFSNKSTYSTNIPITANTITAINVRKNPVITRVAFNRCTTSGVADDEGTHLLSTIKTSFASANYKSDFSIKFTLKTDSGTQVGSPITINAGDSRLVDFYNGITDNNIFLDSFTVSINTAYKMHIELGDAYEKSILTYSIPASFVNVHLSSAANGGVALGKYSASTDAKPLFESNYDTQLKKTLTVDGASTFNGALAVQNTASIKGQLSIKNSSNTNVVTLDQNGNVTANGALTVKENENVTGTLTVDGRSYFNGGFSTTSGTSSYFAGTSEYNNTATFNSTVNFNGNIITWVNIPLFSGITSPGTWGGGRLRVGKVGKHVYISGSCNAKSGDIIGTISSAYRPPSRSNTTGNNFYSIRPCGGARVARVYVNPDGQLILEWVRNLSDGSEYTSAAVWVDCNFDYWLD